ncbi:MAG: V-type ATP synthase subunit I [Clostridium sp. SCN 57-10]|nr:MAG: V-type ATP synthase subunit I [Clostridium sp. SCN 57-10]
MAVVPMQRISICGLKRERKSILEALQRMEIVELRDEDGDNAVFTKTDVFDSVSYLNRQKLAALKALETLNEAAPEKKSMLAALQGRASATADRYDGFIHLREKAKETADRIVRLAASVQECKAEMVKLRLQQEALEPWSNLDVPMSFAGTRATAAFIGVLPGEWQESALYETLGELAPLEAEILSEVKDQTFVFILCLKQHAERMGELLRIQGFAKPGVQSALPPKRQQQQFAGEMARLENQIAEAQAELTSLADQRELLRFYADYQAMREEKYTAIGRLLQSRNTFMLSGYIPKRECENLKAYLEEKFTTDVRFSDPAEDEDVPVLLANNGFARPLESVTKGFSPPGKGEVDPTGIMAFFYYMLFGIMFSDAGYGLVLSAVCGVLLLKFKNMEQSLKNSLKMFFFCGIATIFWGVVFSSYFGDVVDVISSTFFGKTVSIPPLWFSPTAEPMRMLVFSMVLGLVHLTAGLCVKLYQCVKNRQYLDGLYDAVFWMVLLAACVVLLMSSAQFMNVIGVDYTLSKSTGNIAAVVALLAALGIVATGGRESRNPFKRLLKGAYALYGITGYLSDVLSYSRLLALGLATGVIGTVINKMGSMAGSGIGKVIIFIVVFAVGHVLNFAINVLGAYVHTNRLQYVEFFGKFYGGGGREFTPFRGKTKFYKIKEK